MKGTINNKEPNATLLWYALIYNAITIYFIFDMMDDQSSSIIYIAILPTFWITAAIILRYILKKKNIKIESRDDKIAFAFSTPAPFFVLVFIIGILAS